MGIIDAWKSKSRNSKSSGGTSRREKPLSGNRHKDRLAALFHSDGRKDLLSWVGQLEARSESEAALRLLRAGVVRFHPWPQGEEQLATLEKKQFRWNLPELQDAAENQFDALSASRLADALDCLGDRAGAQLWARAAIEEDPCHPEGYLAVARAHLRKFREKSDAVAGLGALRYLTKACQLRPGHGECLRDLATMLLLLKAPKAAGKVLQPLIKAAPRDPMVLALTTLAKELPAENTSNIQELFLRWETGSEPNRALSAARILPSPSGGQLWEIDNNRTLVATCDSASRDDKTIENLSVVSGTLMSTLPQMGIGDFVRFTSRSRGGILLGQSDGESTYFGHSQRGSHEESLHRFLNSLGDKEVSR